MRRRRYRRHSNLEVAMRKPGWTPSIAVALLILAGSAGAEAAQEITLPWEDLPPVPMPVGEGGSLLAGDPGRLYVVSGGGLTSFHRYTLADRSWEALPPVPGIVSGGSSAAYLEDLGQIFILPGAFSTDFQ